LSFLFRRHRNEINETERKAERKREKKEKKEKKRGWWWCNLLEERWRTSRPSNVTSKGRLSPLSSTSRAWILPIDRSKGPILTLTFGF